MGYSTGCHTTFHHRYHLVWAPKYRFKVLRGEVRLRVREIIRQVCAEMGVTIINGALSSDHVHMFVEIRRTSRSATSFAAPRADHRAKSSRSSNTSGPATGGSASGSGAISQPHPATSPTISSCDILTAIPTNKASAPPHDPTGVSRSVIQEKAWASCAWEAKSESITERYPTGWTLRKMDVTQRRIMP